MFLLIGQGAIRRRVSIPGGSGYSQKSIRATCAGWTPLADKTCRSPQQFADRPRITVEVSAYLMTNCTNIVRPLSPFMD
jgi:hypothetical protein